MSNKEWKVSVKYNRKIVIPVFLSFDDIPSEFRQVGSIVAVYDEVFIFTHNNTWEKFLNEAFAFSFMGEWDANQNVPNLNELRDPLYAIYRVSVSGNTYLDGINTWDIGDWVVLLGDYKWYKICNSESYKTKIGDQNKYLLDACNNSFGLTTDNKLTVIDQPWIPSTPALPFVFGTDAQGNKKYFFYKDLFYFLIFNDTGNIMNVNLYNIPCSYLIGKCNADINLILPSNVNNGFVSELIIHSNDSSTSTIWIKWNNDILYALQPKNQHVVCVFNNNNWNIQIINNNFLNHVSIKDNIYKYDNSCQTKWYSVVTQGVSEVFSHTKYIVLNNFFGVIGGVNGNGSNNNSFRYLDINGLLRSSVTDVPFFMQNISNHTVDLLDDYIYIIRDNTIWRASIKNFFNYSSLTTLSFDIMNHGSCVTPGAIWFYGGKSTTSNVYYSTLYQFDLSNNTLNSVLSIYPARINPGVVHWNNRIYIGGGYDINGNFLKELHYYDIDTNQLHTIDISFLPSVPFTLVSNSRFVLLVMLGDNNPSGIRKGDFFIVNKNFTHVPCGLNLVSNREIYNCCLSDCDCLVYWTGVISGSTISYPRTYRIQLDMKILSKDYVLSRFVNYVYKKSERTSHGSYPWIDTHFNQILDWLPINTSTVSRILANTFLRVYSSSSGSFGGIRKVDLPFSSYSDLTVEISMFLFNRLKGIYRSGAFFIGLLGIEISPHSDSDEIYICQLCRAPLVTYDNYETLNSTYFPSISITSHPFCGPFILRISWSNNGDWFKSSISHKGLGYKHFIPLFNFSQHATYNARDYFTDTMAIMVNNGSTTVEDRFFMYDYIKFYDYETPLTQLPYIVY